MKYFENEGALFRGIDRAWPKDVWTNDGWKPYKGKVPKDIEWGDYIDEAEAKRLMGGQDKPTLQAAE